MHFQFPPAAETKLVRATRGAILDIIVDLRRRARRFCSNIAVELSADNPRAIRAGTVRPRLSGAGRMRTETSYQVGEFYTPGAEGGLLYNDPKLRVVVGQLPLARCPPRIMQWFACSKRSRRSLSAR